MQIPDVPQPPANHQQKSAEEKARWLWDTLIGSTVHRPTTRPDLTMASPVTMMKVAGPKPVLAWTLDNQTDVMAPDRPKIIHAQGTVALVDLETEPDSPFTGVLAPSPAGGAVGLVRMSLAVPPSGKKAVTPGIGLKLLIDGAPSLDLLAMNHTVGQGRDINLFSNTFTHDLTREHSELRPPQKLLQVFFQRVSEQPRRLSVTHFSTIQSDGTVVEQPHGPGRLMFRPHVDVRRLFRARAGDDFRDPLAELAAGAVLYEVVAVDDDADGPDRVIGRLRLRESFRSSDGGDRLFFRHVQDDIDRIEVGPSRSA